MVNENIIPKTETVYELKDKYEIPSFEEFMKTYQIDEANEFLTEIEYQDRVLHGPQYGPGNEQSNSSSSDREAKRLLAYMGKQVRDMVVNEIISETFGFGAFAPVGTAQVMVSKLIEQEAGNNKELKELSEKLASDGMSMLRSGAMDALGGLAFQLSYELSEKGLNKTADFIEAAQESYKTYENTKPYFEVVKHFGHLNEGKEYVSGCKVCEE